MRSVFGLWDWVKSLPELGSFSTAVVCSVIETRGKKSRNSMIASKFLVWRLPEGFVLLLVASLMSKSSWVSISRRFLSVRLRILVAVFAVTVAMILIRIVSPLRG